MQPTGNLIQSTLSLVVLPSATLETEARAAYHTLPLACNWLVYKILFMFWLETLITVSLESPVKLPTIYPISTCGMLYKKYRLETLDRTEGTATFSTVDFTYRNHYLTLIPFVLTIYFRIIYI